MKNKIYSLVLFTLLSICGIQAQVETKITDVTLNGQTVIKDCGVIDFGTNTNNTLSFYFKLKKPTAQAIGTSNLKIFLKYDSSSYGSERGNLIVQTGNWGNNNTEFISTILCSISESEIKTTGSSIVLEFITDSGIKTRSCEYPITKTPPPSFSFSPASVSIHCGDVSAKTFTVTPSNIPSGANVTYQWSYSGWSGTTSSVMNTVVLTPSSGSYLPSQVSVTPFINGVSQPTKTCTVNRSAFSTTGQINNDVICTVGSSNTYSLSGLAALSSSNTISWSTSNTSVATVTSSANETVLITAQSRGTFLLKATITNPCGEIVEISSAPIDVEMPTVQPKMLGLNVYDTGYYSPAYISDLPHDWIGVNNPLELTSTTITGSTLPADWEWQNVSGRFVFSGSNVNGNNANGKTQKISFINGEVPDKIEFRCRAKSLCNWSEWKTFVLNFTDGNPVVVPTPPVTPAKYFTVSPNPVTNVININTTTTPPSGAQMPPLVAVFSIYGGQAIIPKTMIQGGFAYGSLNTNNLSPGFYVLTIYWGTLVESHNFIKIY